MNVSSSSLFDSMGSVRKDEFMRVYEKIIEEELKEIETSYKIPSFAIEQVKFCTSYNVPHGKLQRGTAVVESYCAFANLSIEEVPEVDLHQACILGWCVEWLQAFFLVVDDIMDSSQTRRGQKCYYLLPKVGMNAINDAMILQSFIYRLLYRYFRDLDFYVKLVDIFQQVTFVTELGQLLDTGSQNTTEDSFSVFTKENLERIYDYKTGNYTFYLPFALGLILSRKDEDDILKRVYSLCMELGKYFQAQDDFLDCFGDPEITGKIGTDIEDNKCSWLIVNALSLCSTDQIQTLKQCYGKHDNSCVEQVKNIYRTVGLVERFEEFESKY
ncbi:farnesyl pyrophosphate synthase [Galdieria sulphuraria]|uniref:Farnesyl pyrophosphate synthase n=1 Tax=Galdieria sulphuraria TaxID=130081 RepID=M2XHL9_GALSU|nr:farnesyl pyrophosphate synthase [Galdieria sulphuraria]EME29582.1 farnesyl pyrophosphate synthase [Galdieria sulphuraria]|eukprot:XP_005706102.1 farnesyl pyrophosphate synthase [Galdieria sulphuraria]